MALQKRHIEHMQIWQASGLTQAMYCQQQGLNAKTFSRWFKTYQLSNQPTKPLLIPVEIKAAANSTSFRILKNNLRFQQWQKMRYPKANQNLLSQLVSNLTS